MLTDFENTLINSKTNHFIAILLASVIVKEIVQH